MFSPADNHRNKHIWALLLSVFSTEIWGTGPQKRLPCYLFFLLSCNPWHPDGTLRCFWLGGIPYQKQARKEEHPVLKPIVIIADPWLPRFCSTKAIQERDTRNSWNNNVYCCIAQYMEAYVLVLRWGKGPEVHVQESTGKTTATSIMSNNSVTSHTYEGVLLPWNKATIGWECLLASAKEGLL